MVLQNMQKHNLYITQTSREYVSLNLNQPEPEPEPEQLNTKSVMCDVMCDSDKPQTYVYSNNTETDNSNAYLIMSSGFIIINHSCKSYQEYTPD